MKVISGFPWPVEQERLAVLLRGPQPALNVIETSAQRMNGGGPVLFLCPFGKRVTCVRADMYPTGSCFVGALTDSVLLARAQPVSKIKPLAQEAAE